MELISKFLDKNNKINKQFKIIFNKLSELEKNYIMNFYDKYSKLSDKLKALHNGDYKKCTVCEGIMSYDRDDKKTCSSECRKNR